MFIKFFLSPVEQFMILPLLPLFKLITVDNVFILIFIIIIFFFFNLFILFKRFDFDNNYGLYIIPTRFQIVLEQIFKGGLNLTKENINSTSAQFFFPLISVLFFFLLNSNMFGLIPYSYTITSHLIVTLSISLYLFIGLNIICFKKHSFKLFSLFLPGGTKINLAFLLVPIEFILYLFKPVSLAIRLFVNMMAGHTLLKVIAGFSWTLVSLGNFIFLIFHLIPTFVLIPLFVLETAVAVIQSFVFTVLICIYLNDALNLH